MAQGGSRNAPAVRTSEGWGWQEGRSAVFHGVGCRTSRSLCLASHLQEVLHCPCNMHTLLGTALGSSL